MAIKKAWVGGRGPLQYDDTDVYSDDPALFLQGARIEGQIIVESAPTAANHVLRFGDVTTYRVLNVEVADIDDPTDELANYDGGDAVMILAQEVDVVLGGDSYTLYAHDSSASSVSSSPYAVAGSSGFWIAVAGRYAQNTFQVPNIIANSTITAQDLTLTDDLIVGDDADVVGDLTARTIVSDTTLASGTTMGVGTVLTVAERISVTGDASNRVKRTIAGCDIAGESADVVVAAYGSYVISGNTGSGFLAVPNLAVGDVVKKITIVFAVNDATGAVLVELKTIATGSSYQASSTVATILVSNQSSNNLTIASVNVDITIAEDTSYAFEVALDGGGAGIASLANIELEVETRKY